jgi:hypothetical protein
MCRHETSPPHRMVTLIGPQSSKRPAFGSSGCQAREFLLRCDEPACVARIDHVPDSVHRHLATIGQPRLRRETTPLGPRVFRSLAALGRHSGAATLLCVDGRWTAVASCHPAWTSFHSFQNRVRPTGTGVSDRRYRSREGPRSGQIFFQIRNQCDLNVGRRFVRPVLLICRMTPLISKLHAGSPRLFI